MTAGVYEPYTQPIETPCFSNNFCFSNEEKIKDPSACPPLQNPPTSSPQQEAYQSQPKPDPQTIAAEFFAFFIAISTAILLYSI